MNEIKTDSLGLSLIWGRIGAGVLMFVAFALNYFGYTVTAEDKAAIDASVQNAILLVAGAMALFSKFREVYKKVKATKG